MRYLLIGIVVAWGISPVSARAAEEASAERLHLQKGRYAEALEAYDALLKTEKLTPQIAIGRSQCFQAQGKWQDATEALEAATKAFPEDAGAWARLAEVQFLQGRYEQAAAAVEKSLKINEDTPLARMIQADLLAETGKIDEADAAYRWFVQYYNRVQPTDAETLVLVARGAAQYARWNSVSQIFSFVINTVCPDALEADANAWQAYHFSGSLLLEKYNRGQAVPEFRSALAINPRSADVYAEMARAAAQDFELDEAREFAERALQIAPNHVAALQVRSEVEFSEGKTEAALATLQEALKVNPRDQETLARTAACYLMLDGFPSDESLAALLAAFDAEKPAEMKEESRFGKLVIDLATVNPRPGKFFTLLGEQLESKRKFALSERCYKFAMQRMPMLAEPQTALGMLYMQIGRVDEAGAILDKAFDLDPYHVRVSNMRKVIKVLSGYETITTDHFVIRVDSEFDKVLGRYMAEYLEEEYGKLVKQFGYEPPTRTHFEVYNKSQGLSAHQWFSARMVGLPWIQTIGASTGLIVALASPTAVEEPFNWARVLRHEFVHILTLQQTHFNIPHWFTEALAVRNEGYPRSQTWNLMLARRVPRDEIMTLETINQAFIKPETPEDWQMAYCQSEIYAEYMVKLAGEESLGKMLNAYRDNLDTAAAIQRVFGMDQAAFEKGYRTYLDQTVAAIPQPASADEVQPKTLAELEKAFRADPDNATTRGEYAAGLLEAGQFKQARKFANSALKKNSAEPQAAIVLAQLEIKGANPAQAIEYLNQALDEQNPHPGVVKWLGQLQLKAQNYAEAARVYELIRKDDAENVEWVKMLSVAYLNLGDTEKLKPLLKQFVELEFDQIAPRKKLAAVYLSEKNYDEALHYAKTALYIDVLDVEVHRLLGEAYAGKKQYDRAIEEFEVALELKPEDADLTYALGKAQHQAGDNQAAEKTLRRLLLKHPKHTAAQELLEKL